MTEEQLTVRMDQQILSTRNTKKLLVARLNDGMVLFTAFETMYLYTLASYVITFTEVG